VLDDHNLRGFGITPIRSSHSHGMGGHSGSKRTSIRHEITRLCCSICRRPSYMEGNGSKSGAPMYSRPLPLLSPPPHSLDLLLKWLAEHASTSSLHALIGDAKQMGAKRPKMSTAPHFRSYTTGCFVVHRLVGIQASPSLWAPHFSWQNTCCDTPAWRNR
jgi:hypothetical protein